MQIIIYPFRVCLTEILTAVTAEMWLQRDLGIPQALGLQGVISQVRNATPGRPGSPTSLCPSIGRQGAGSAASQGVWLRERCHPRVACSHRSVLQAAGRIPARAPVPIWGCWWSPLPPQLQVCAWRTLITACRGRSGQCSGCT